MPDQPLPVGPVDPEVIYGPVLDTFMPGLFDVERNCRFRLMALRDAANLAVRNSRSEAVNTLSEVNRLAAIYAMTPMKLRALFRLVIALEGMMDAARFLEKATR